MRIVGRDGPSAVNRRAWAGLRALDDRVFEEEESALSLPPGSAVGVRDLLLPDLAGFEDLGLSPALLPGRDLDEPFAAPSSWPLSLSDRLPLLDDDEEDEEDLVLPPLRLPGRLPGGESII